LNPRSRSEGRILFFACAAHCLTHVYMSMHTGILDPMRESFGLTIPDLAGYATILAVLFGFGALPSAWLGERFGEKNLLVAFFVLTAAGGIFVGLGHGTAALAAGMAALGIGTSIFHPVGNTFIAKGIAMPGRAMGTNGLWGSLGQAVGPLFAALMSALYTWRAGYLALAPLMLLLAAWLAASRIEMPARRTEAHAGHPVRDTGDGRWSILALLLLAMTMAGFNYWLVVTMLVKHIELQSGFESETAALLAGYSTCAIYLVGGAGQYLAGRLVHRRDGRGAYVLVFALSAPLVYLTGREWLTGIPLIVVAGLMSLAIFASQPIENVLLSRFSPERWRSTFFGLKFTMAFGLGGAGSWLSGVILKKWGMSAVFTTGSLFLLGALALALAARARGSTGRPGLPAEPVPAASTIET